MTAEELSSFAGVLQTIAREAKRAKKAQTRRGKAQLVIDAALGEKKDHARVSSYRQGVLVLETDSPAFFQELEGFHRARLLDALRAAGLEISALRVRLTRE
jgi:hypothetical protein